MASVSPAETGAALQFQRDFDRSCKNGHWAGSTRTWGTTTSRRNSTAGLAGARDGSRSSESSMQQSRRAGRALRRERTFSDLCSLSRRVQPLCIPAPAGRMSSCCNCLLLIGSNAAGVLW